MKNRAVSGASFQNLCHPRVMQHGLKRRPPFRHSVLIAVGSIMLLSLIGCAGSKTDGSPQPEATAGRAPSAALGGSTASTPAASTSGGASALAAGSGGDAPVGGGQSGGAHAGGASGSGSSEPTNAGGLDFSHGTRLLIPQRNFDGANIGVDEFLIETADPIDLTIETPLVDAPIYARQFEVSFASNLLLVKHCQERKAKFEPTSVEVKQDVGGNGSHLKIEQANGQYQLTHDGPGKHEVHVTGTLHVEAIDAMGLGCAPHFPQAAVDIPVTLAVHLTIQHLGSITASPPFDCGTAPVIWSGRGSGGIYLTLLNDTGQPISGANVYSSYPADVIVETEGPAQIAEAGSGLNYYGLIVTGDPQRVRLSTSYGTLFTYFLANTSLIDGMDVKFWSRPEPYVKSPTTPLAMDSTPAVASTKVLGATATLSVGGVPICPPPLASDYQTTLLSPQVCNVPSEVGTDLTAGIPGFLTTFVAPVGTCELEISVPGANGGRGLSTHLSAVLKPTVN